MENGRNWTIRIRLGPGRWAVSGAPIYFSAVYTSIITEHAMKRYRVVVLAAGVNPPPERDLREYPPTFKSKDSRTLTYY
jgi:hypothetical protein